MDDKQNAGNNTSRHPYVIPRVKHPAEVVKNPNPKANKNIRVRTEESKSQNTEPANGVGSEITDGEDA